MKICSLSSGSKGNCTLIGSDNTKIMLDAGVGVKFILECLEKLSVDPREIEGILVTHEHSDHIKGLESFCKKFDTPIFCAMPLYNVLCSQMPSCAKLINVYKDNFNIGDLKIFPFELSHDSTACFGYRICDESGSASFVTDTGYLPNTAFKVIENSSLVFLESNYDPDMLYSCSYPMFLKKRIIGNKGHLSNLDCAKVIARLSKTGTKLVVLSHISENSNTPYLAYNTIKNYLDEKEIFVDKDIKIGINYQNKLNTVYKIKKK